MNKQNIYCVKIAQRVLSQIAKEVNIFPYDRVYITPNTQIEMFTKIFRYYFSMPLTKIVYDALNRLHVTSINKITVRRNDQAYTGGDGKHHGNFLSLVSPEDVVEEKWSIIAPTYAYRDADGYLRIAYCMTKAVNGEQNKRTIFPRISLHTPQQDIAFVCAICSNIADYHAGSCSPGTTTCFTYHNLRFKSIEKEIEEQESAEGEEEWGSDLS